MNHLNVIVNKLPTSYKNVQHEQVLQLLFLRFSPSL